MGFFIPLWILQGLLASFVNTGIPLVQEKFRADAFSVAVWVKITVVALSFPVVLYQGWPDDPDFYLMTFVSSILWCISDVIYYRTIPAVGAGVVSRILPASVIVTFVAWFGVDPDLFGEYMRSPLQFGLLGLIVLLSVVFAVFMKSCPVTWKGMRMIWFVVFAASIGPIMDKLALGYAPSSRAPVSFMFFQALMMLGLWGLVGIFRKPVPARVFFSKGPVVAGLLIGLFATAKLWLKFEALRSCDHPALLSVILFTDALWIILFYRLTGRQDQSKVWAGLGLVACAVALILVKSFQLTSP